MTKACPGCNGVLRDARWCLSCGADLFDPDVQHLASSSWSEVDAWQDADEFGTLTIRRVLGVSYEGLTSGRAMRKLALLGGVLLFLAFLVPVTLNFVKFESSWEAARLGPRFALLFPGVAAVIAVALALLSVTDALNTIRHLALVILGLSGVFFALAPLGGYARTATEFPFFWVGVLIAGAALAGRLLYPTDTFWRITLIAGAVVALLFMLVPLSDVGAHFSIEFKFNRYASDFDKNSITAIFWGGIKGGVLFGGLWGSLPLWVIPLSAVAAFPKPQGLTDQWHVLLRFAAWAILLYIPISYGFDALSAFGKRDDVHVYLGDIWTTQRRFSNGVLAGRLRLILTASACIVWAQFGTVALYAQWRQKKQKASANPKPLKPRGDKA